MLGKHRDAVSIALPPTWLLLHTSASSLVPLPSSTSHWSPSRTPRLPHATDCDLLMPTIFISKRGWIATLFDNTSWLWVPLLILWTLTNGKREMRESRAHASFFTSPFMDFSRVCFLLANFPEKPHTTSENTTERSTLSLHKVCCWAALSPARTVRAVGVGQARGPPPAWH